MKPRHGPRAPFFPVCGKKCVRNTVEGVSEADAKRAMQLAAAKLPILTKFAKRFAQERAS